MEILQSSTHPDTLTENLIEPINQALFDSFRQFLGYKKLLKQVGLSVFRGLADSSQVPLDFKPADPSNSAVAIDPLTDVWSAMVKTDGLFKYLQEPTKSRPNDIVSESLFNGGDDIDLKIHFLDRQIATQTRSRSQKLFKSIVVEVDKKWSPCGKSVMTFFKIEDYDDCQKTYVNSQMAVQFVRNGPPVLKGTKSIFLSRRIWTEFKNWIIFDPLHRKRVNIYNDQVTYNLDLSYSINIATDLFDLFHLPAIKIRSDILAKYRTEMADLSPNLTFTFEDLSTFLRSITLEENEKVGDKHGILSFLQDKRKQVPLLTRVKDFLKVLSLDNKSYFEQNPRAVLNQAQDYRFFIEMNPNGLVMPDAMEYIKSLNRNYEFYCLNYMEVYEKYKVRVEPFEEVDIENGQLDFGLRVKVDLYEELTQDFKLI